GIKQRTDDAGDELLIVYAIDAGARHKLVRLEIKGNKYFLSDQIRARMQVHPAARFESRGRYSQALLAGDIRGIEDLYRANGFQQIKISSKLIDDYAGRENDLALDLTVDEGPQTLVGEFRIEGIHSYTQDQLSAYINTAKGQPFSEYNIATDRDNLL